MRKKLQTLNKHYFIKWTPDEVCRLLREHAIRAEDMIQSSRAQTRRLIRELYLLACQAGLVGSARTDAQASLLSRYASAIKQISHDYDNLFRRTRMIETANPDPQNAASVETIDRLQARLFYLLTQYSVHPCQHLAGHIVEQLNCLCQHPHIELLPTQRYIYSQSLNYWRSRVVMRDKCSQNMTLH